MSSILVGFTGTILGYQTFKFWCPCPTQFPHFRNEQLQEIATEQLEHCFRPTEVCWVLPQHLSCEKNNCDHCAAGILAETTITWKKWWFPANFPLFTSGNEIIPPPIYCTNPPKYVSIPIYTTIWFLGGVEYRREWGSIVQESV